MDIANIPIPVLGIIIFALLCLFMIVRGLKLPADFYERDKQRAAMRRRLRELEAAGQTEGEAAVPAPAVKQEKRPEPPKSAGKPAAASPVKPSKPVK
jgi:hypothetical protein